MIKPASRGMGRGTAICRGGIPAGGGTLFFLPAEAAGEAGLDDRLGAGDEHGVLGDIPGDGGPGGGVGARPHGDGGDQVGITAEEGIVADGGAEFFLAVKIGDGHAAAEIHPAAAVGIADIGEVGNGGFFADIGIFDLNKITDLTAGSDVAAGADLRKRPDGHIVFEGGTGDVGVFDGAVFADDGIGKDAARPDDRAGPDDGIAAQDTARQDGGAGGYGDGFLYHDAVPQGDEHAGGLQCGKQRLTGGIGSGHGKTSSLAERLGGEQAKAARRSPQQAAGRTGTVSTVIMVCLRFFCKGRSG